MLQPLPDYECAKYYVGGLLESFKKGYSGPEGSRFTKNAVTAEQYPDNVRLYIQKEILLGHTLKPLSKPLPNFVIFSLDVRLKKTGGVRLIMDLSRTVGNSINDCISKEDLRYSIALLMMPSELYLGWLKGL